MSTKKLFIFLVIFMFIFVLSIPLTHAAISESSSKFWKKVFIEHIQNFEYRSKEIDYLIFRINDDIEEFRDKTKQYDIQFHQLKFIMNNVINNPYEYRLVIAELDNLESSYLSLYQEIQSLDESANTYLTMLTEMEKDLVYLSKENIHSPDVLVKANQLLINIRILSSHLELEVIKMNLSLGSMKVLIDKLNNLENFLEKSFSKQLRLYFLIPGPAIQEIKWSEQGVFAVKAWINTLPSVFRERFPDTGKEYLTLLIILSLSLLIYLFLRLLLVKKYLIKNILPGSNEYLLRALASFFAFIGLFITSAVLIFPETILFFRLGIILFGFFAWFFTLGLRAISQPEKSNDNLLATLFVLFALGICYQLLGINYTMLVLIWPATLLLSLIYNILKHWMIIKSFRNAGFWFFCIISVLLLLLSIKGFLYLSVFLCMIWFLGVVLIRMCIALTWLMKKLIHNSKIHETLYSALLTGFGIPILWFLTILFLSIWASMQISANPLILFKYFIGIHFSIQGFEIKAINLVSVIFIFFIFKCFISSLNEYLQSSPLAFKTNQRSRHNIIPSLQTLVGYVFWFIYLIIFLAIFKINITSLLVILGGLSVGIGFGLQHLFNNFMSGLIIMFGGTCRPGDIVEVEGMWATVKTTDIRTTTIQTFENCIVTVPNSVLIDKSFKNWTKNNDLIRKDIKIGVMYGSDITKVTEILLDIANSTDGICSKPMPQVIFTDFGDSALIFKLRFWMPDIDNIVVVPSKLRYEIDKRFNENGIVIAYPQLDLNIKEIPHNKSITVKETS